MLVLTRKVDEVIIIGEDIKVTVVKIKGDTVKLGIEAPDKTNIERGDIKNHDRPTQNHKALNHGL